MVVHSMTRTLRYAWLMRPGGLFLRKAVITSFSKTPPPHWGLRRTPLLAITEQSYCVTASLHKNVQHSNKGAKRVKTEQDENIHLFDSNGGSLGILSKEDAKRKAREQHLRLVEIVINDSEVPVFKLMSSREYVEEQKKLKELKKAQKPKALKALQVNSKIAQHDLDVKTRVLLEWLNKGHKARITIKDNARDEGKSQNKVFEHFTSSCKDLAKVQEAQRTTGYLYFILSPKILNQESVGTSKPMRPLKIEEMKKKD